MLADIVPAGTAVDASALGTWGSDLGTWETNQLQRWAYEGTSTDGRYPLGTFTNNLDGTYTYAFATAYDNPTFEVTGAYTSHGSARPAATLAEVAPSLQATADYQRLIVKIGDDPNDVHYSRNVLVQDFQIAPTTNVVTLAANPQRVLAPATGCKECHSDTFQQAQHASSYMDTKACNYCHTPISNWPHSATSSYGSDMQADGAYLQVLVHQIHAANNTFDATADTGFDYSEVTYPQEVANCKKCHNGDDSMTDAWKTNPTAQVCGSCHIAVDFVAGTNHVGGPQADNAACSGCHNATAIAGYHADALLPLATDLPEFAVTIAIAGATGAAGEFVEGDVPVVTVTLVPAAGGTVVDYLAAGTGNVLDGKLVEAELTVYGPRAHADVALGGGGDLLLSTENDGNSFKYTMNAIPADMTGTYLVHFEGADYGFVSDTDYRTHSSATQAFQVGTAIVEPKVAGDNCTNCHGATRMHVPGQHAHNVSFDTDECLACHNYSGGYGTPIPQRVHAVHSASAVGADGHNRSWTEVTFPQGANNCQACHTSGKTT